MIKKIGRAHWMGHKFHFGFYTRGNCWKLFSFPRLTVYGGGVIWLSWWRFFLSITSYRLAARQRAKWTDSDASHLLGRTSP